MFVAFALGEGEPHLDPYCRRVGGPWWQLHLGYLQGGKKTRRHSVRVPDEVVLRWDPYFHREEPVMKQENYEAAVTTFLVSQRAFEATKELTYVCYSLRRKGQEPGSYHYL